MQNEDCFGHNDNHGLYVVADGMGGRPFGALAARIVVDSTLAVGQRHSGAAGSVENALKHAKDRLRRAATTCPDLSWMGSTVALLHLERHGQAAVAHVGDSRVYRLRTGNLERLTDDHNVPSSLAAKGLLTSDQADTHPLRHLLTRYLCPDGGHDATVTRCSALPGDRFLLCSDGLSEMLSDEAVGACLRHSPSDESACHRLIEAARTRDTHDNITVLVVDVLGEE